MTTASRPTSDTAAGPAEQPQRRDHLVAAKKGVLLLLGVVCFVACTSCIHYNVYLNRSLSSVPIGEGRASSATTVPSVPKKWMAGSKKGGLRNPGKQRRSRQIDSWSNQTSTNKTTRPVKRHLDFVIAGFPKTGTTSLLYAFSDHPETAIASSERCAVTSPMATDEIAFKKLQEALSELSPSRHVKRAIKCPGAVYHAYNSIVRMEQHAPNAKFVIGVRHPILMLESYYNYRVTELHDRVNRTKEPMEAIPPLDRLIGLDKEWKGVSTESTDFKTYLLQFGKTKVATRDLQDMTYSWNKLAEKKNYNMAIKPNKIPIFLYTVDQLEDTGDSERSDAFRSGLQHFLGLQTPLKPVGRENLNRFVGKAAYPETVNICLPKYNSMRRMLLMQGNRSAEWIETEFLQSPDVTVANRNHFLASIRSWSVDPCSYRMKQKENNKKSLAVTLVRRAKKVQHVKHSKKGAEEKKLRRLRMLAKKQEEKKRVFVGRKRRLEVLLVKL